MIFDARDSKGSGAIGWRAFLAAMSTLKCGTNAEKLDLIYRFYDKTAQDSLSYKDLTKIIQIRLAQDLNEIADYLESVAETYSTEIFKFADVPTHRTIS
jgi:Ca2+-binding EF-hand superfamily protein